MPKSLPMIDLTATLCCAPVASGVISDDDALAVALRLKAVADPVRVKLLSLLLASDIDGVRNSDLARHLELSDATISHHLGQLHRAGLLTRSRRGTSIYYRVDRNSLAALVRVIDPDCCL
ncbi:Rv2640c family ArsR-like transcriptional regulator [Ferrimicrobium sp.]|uniref:Rv2640c family ArsR-like transcriptional regulator n=1 Tax=Ferrimicrobium sp. TaxID=2926050 RepID=UPI00261616E8|nr:Rv2640c family ArsR-like transcriptional regulator [Ferrimicrobium sp.]